MMSDEIIAAHHQRAETCRVTGINHSAEAETENHCQQENSDFSTPQIMAWKKCIHTTKNVLWHETKKPRSQQIYPHDKLCHNLTKKHPFNKFIHTTNYALISLKIATQQMYPHHKLRHILTKKTPSPHEQIMP